MQTIEEVKGGCKFVADGIAKAVEEGAGAVLGGTRLSRPFPYRRGRDVGDVG